MSSLKDRQPHTYLLVFYCVTLFCIYGGGQDVSPPCEVGLMVRRGTTWTAAPRQRVIVKCPFTDCGEPLTVTWCKVSDADRCEQINHTENVQQVEKRVKDELISFLTFKRISIHDAGLYGCSLKGYKYEVISHTINISVSDSYQRVKNSIDTTDESLIVASYEDLSWLPYFYICVSIALLVTTLIVFTLLSFHGRKHESPPCEVGLMVRRGTTWTAAPRQRVIVKCPFTDCGEPLTVTWCKVSDADRCEQINHTENVQQVEKRVKDELISFLTFKRISIHDAGLYGCSLKGYKYEVISHTINISVSDSYQWVKNSIDTTDESLSVAGYEDLSWLPYFCICVSIALLVTTLIVFTLLSFHGRKHESPPCEVGLMVRRGTTWTAAPRQRVIVKCPFTDCGEPLTVTWCKVSDADRCEQINHTENVQQVEKRVKDELISFLTFKRISIHDAGLYGCSLKGYKYEVISHTINISVSDSYQWVKNSIDTTDESLSVAGYDDLSWLPYFCICVSIALLVTTLIVFTLLSFHGRKHESPPCEVGLMVRRGTTWTAAPRQRVIVKCPFTDCGEPLTVTWCKVSDADRCEQINHTENVQQVEKRVKDELISFLTFKRISIHDAGLYGCSLKGYKYEVISHTINISVSDSYQRVKNSIDTTDESLSVAGYDDLSWLPYFCICVSIALLVTTLIVFTLLSFHGRKHESPPCEVGLMVRRGTTWTAAPRQRVIVKCPFTDCGEPLTVTWCKVSDADRCEQINHTENVQQVEKRVKDELISFLTFKRISIHDAGLYGCSLKGYKYEVISHTINISVSDSYQRVKNSIDTTDESLSVAGYEDLSWLPYFCICVSIALLVTTLIVFTLLSFHGRKHESPPCEVGLMVRRGTTWTAAPRQRVIVKCPFTDCGEPLTVTWCKVSDADRCEQINHTENVQQVEKRVKDELISFLTFKRISIHDAGLYGCSLKGYEYEVISHTINISVSDSYQGVKKSIDTTDGSPSAAGDEDLSWPAYVICLSVALLLAH